MARILIFEPHSDIRTLLEIVVKRLGHEPVAGDAHGEALTDVAAAVVDPGETDGLVLAKRLRQSGVPVILTSIYPAEAETLDLTPSAYLVKPFALYVLEQALEGAVAVRPARAAVSS